MAKNLIKDLLLFSLAALIVSDMVVKKSTQQFLYNNVETIPYNRVGLLLGTSKYLGSGRLNYYYQNRIEAALQLFHAHKIDFIIVSGDNSRVEYDEPTDMKNDLVAGGVPEERIFLDYAGFRTLDSVVRCRDIFGQSSITVISQRFHDERAVFLAHHHQIASVGFCAEDVSKFYGLKTMMRERLARVKLFIDLIINKQPKFSGEPITIDYAH